MTEPTEQQRIDRLAEWYNEGKPAEPVRQPSLGGPWYVVEPEYCLSEGKLHLWRPFDSHDDAFLLVEECERRRLMDRVAILLRSVGLCDVDMATRCALLLDAEYITKAVEAVAFPEEK